MSVAAAEFPPVARPALHGLAKGYPRRFAKRVPKTVVMRKDVRPDWLCLLAEPDEYRGVEAVKGQVYPAWTNAYWAVAVVFQDGRKLGVKPDKFQEDSWHPKEVPCA